MGLTASLRDLSEADFRTGVLIPLMKAMGYRDVFHHHGSDELGKDIVAYLPLPDETRQYAAVVVKKGNINAKADGHSGTVGTQVQQAFGSPYLDPKTGDERHIQRVIVATTGDIPSRAKEALQATLMPFTNRQVSFWDGSTVVELLEKYLPSRTIPDLVSEAWLRFPQLKHFAISAALTPSGATRWDVVAKSPNVRIADAVLSFPKTERGDRVRTALERFVEEGGEVTIPGEFIDSFERHPELVSAFGSEIPAEITIGQAESTALREVRLVVYGPSLSSPLYYDGLLLKRVKSGRKRTRLESEGEQEPLSIGLEIDTGGDAAQIAATLKFTAEGSPVRRAYKVYRVWEALASGATFDLVDAESGAHFLRSASLPTDQGPAPELVEYLKDLIYLEDHFGWDLMLPERISESDLKDAEELRQVIEAGSHVSDFSTHTIDFKPNAGLDLLSMFPPNEKRWILLTYGSMGYTILDREVELGPGCCQLEIFVAPADRKRLAKQSRSGQDSVRLTMTKASDSEGASYFYRNYMPPDWQARFDESASKAISGETPKQLGSG